MRLPRLPSLPPIVVRGPGLLARVALTLACATLLPLLVVPILIGLNREAMTDQVLRLHAVAARTTAAQLADEVAGWQRTAETLARHPALAEDPLSSETRRLLSGLLQAQPRLAALALIDAGGAEVLRAQAPELAAPVQRVLLQGGGDEPLVARDAGRLWLRLGASVPGGRGRVRLVAEAEVLQGQVRPLELGEQALLAVARPGELLVISDAAATLDSFPPGLVAQATSGRLSGSGRFPATSGEMALGAHAPVAGTDWFVLSRQPVAVAEKVARGMRTRALWAVALALALAIGLSTLAWAVIVRPLRRLASAQRDLAGLAPTRRQDEIGELEDAFRVLQRQSRDRDAAGRTFLGRYQVLQPIGNGGMGTVFKAYDPKLQRTVALKTLRFLHLPRAREQVTGLLREAVTVARFSHPHIVAVHDVEDTPEAAFIVMELVEGSSLDRLLSGGVGLPSSQIATLGLAVARALEAAHAQGIVHRDVKPANVLLGREGSIKVTDFGIADLVSSIGRGDTVFGTPGYIAPEALRGEGQGAPGDLFALGVILYFCATGTHPFTAPSTAQVLKATLAHAPRPPHLLQVGLHAELEGLILGLLARSPAERQPGTAAALADRLEGLCVREGWRWETPALASARPVAESPASHSVLLENLTDRGWTTRGPARPATGTGPHEEAP